MANFRGGEILNSPDYGKSWIKRVGGYPQMLRGIAFPDTQTGFVCGFGGTLLETTDAGVSWQSTNSSTNSNLYVCAFPDQAHGFCGGAGVILNTTDGGVTWSAYEVPNGDDVSGFYFKDAKNGWATGGSPLSEEGIVLHTTDGGTSWNTQFSGMIGPLESVCFRDSLTGWAVGYDLLKTTNGGQSWSEDMWPTPLTTLFERVLFTDRANGWLVDIDGEVFHTQNGGDSWQSQQTPTSNPLLDITIRQDGSGIAVGSPGTILMIPNAFVTSVMGGNPLAVRANLSLAQNYPNPFNPSTTIRYTLSIRSHVLLYVFNTLGQRVATIVDGEVNAGSHEVKFDSSNFASGVYFYRLTAGDYVSTKKLILLR